MNNDLGVKIYFWTPLLKAIVFLLHLNFFCRTGPRAEYSGFDVNVVDSPVSFVLHDSVASCDPEEGIALRSHIWFHIVWLD